LQESWALDLSTRPRVLDTRGKVFRERFMRNGSTCKVQSRE
jgi:hypothetical protein